MICGDPLNVIQAYSFSSSSIPLFVSLIILERFQLAEKVDFEKSKTESIRFFAIPMQCYRDIKIE